MSRLASVAVLLALVVADVRPVHAAYPPRDVPSTFPHDYPGKPSGDFSPAWQSYFEVNGSLPNVTWELPRNFAGNIPVNRAGHPNDTLFFWAFEKENGSLTAGANDRASEPWGIWLNGGPGSSSLIGLTSENGPIHINADFSAQQNNFSWDRLADYVWVDQPVGVGFSTADSAGFVHDEDEMGRDFMGFLSNLVKVFPSLKTRPLYVTGESYAGTYIPYIMKTYFGLTDPPVNIAKFAIGDGTVGSFEVFELLPTVTTIETYPQLIGYDPAVFEFFREQTHLCGYDLNLTYPQNGHFPPLTFVEPSNNEEPFRSLSRFNSRTRHETRLRAREVLRNAKRSAKIEQRDSLAAAAAKKRDLSGRANGTIDPWYGCDIYDEMIDYAVNFSAPWNVAHDNFNGFDVYQVPDALDPEANMDASFFFNDAKTRAALHAPTSKNWTGSIFYPFLGDPLFQGNDPSVEPMAFLTDLAANASAHNVSVILYSGNDDSLVAHRGTEVVIQNTTFGGIQGFTRQPSTPWIDDNGDVGGIVHQERNWTYVLIEGAGHLVPYTNPGRGFVLLREFILGNNQTGLVTNSSGNVNVVGGESSALAVDAIPGQLGIFVGSGTTQSTYTFPSATIAAWNSYIATATVIPPGGLAASGSGSATGPKATGNGAARGVEACGLLVALSLGVAMVVGGAV